MTALALEQGSATESPISIEDARFGVQVGTPLDSHSVTDPASDLAASVDFRGTSGISCASFDLNAFLHAFDPHELLNELRQSLISGAQSAVSNYLIALAYSAPTLASVLDMTDRQLATRFSAFAQTCGAQQVRLVGVQDGGRLLAQASEQCFASEIARGAAPTEAYRSCTVARRFAGLALPATLSTVDFLRRHSDLAITPRIDALLRLLPDQRIDDGRYQIRSPQISIASLSEGLRSQARLALNQALDGRQPSTVTECPTASIVSASGAGCLPTAAFAIVNSSAFRGARLLGASTRSMLTDALASQIAAVAVYSDLLDLARHISRMNLRANSSADAEDVRSRQRSLQQAAADLLNQADMQVKLQESQMRLVRTQLLALERAESDLSTRAAALRAEEERPSFSGDGLLRLFRDRN